MSGYERILDPSNGTDDFGFYAQNGYARYVGANVDHIGDNVVFADGVYATVAITSQPSPTRTRFYVNGSLQLDDTKTEPVIADTLRFFKDNVTGTSTGEDRRGPCPASASTAACSRTPRSAGSGPARLAARSPRRRDGDDDRRRSARSTRRSTARPSPPKEEVQEKEEALS